MIPRLKEKYSKEIVPELKTKFGLRNVMEVPRLKKIVVNMGLGDAPSDPKIMETAMAELAAITGQKPVVTKAKKSISNFKLRVGAKIGCMVTLRGDRMYEFLDRLVNVALPRIRDFRGISPKSFDAHGNFTLGIREQTIFPEVNLDNIMRFRGMNVCFAISNSDSEEKSRELLRAFGMPFRPS